MLKWLTQKLNSTNAYPCLLYFPVTLYLVATMHSGIIFIVSPNSITTFTCRLRLRFKFMWGKEVLLYIRKTCNLFNCKRRKYKWQKWFVLKTSSDVCALICLQTNKPQRRENSTNILQYSLQWWNLTSWYGNSNFFLNTVIEIIIVRSPFIKHVGLSLQAMR